jgi:protein gp37
MAHRFKRDFTPQLHEDRLMEPMKLKTPSKIFVCSMSDLHGDGVQPKWIDEVWYAMTRARHHTYQLLTKHPERYDGDPFPGTAMWFGATVTDQASWDHACEHLSKLPSNVVRWISAEPMLGEIRITGDWVPNWVVVGALTGHGDLKKIESSALGRGLTARLQLLGVPVFQKDSLGLANPARRWPQ